MYNVNNGNNGNGGKNSNENQQKPPKSFNKLGNSNQMSKSSNKDVKSSNSGTGNGTGHNYWANKNDEFAQGQQRDFMSKMHDKKETRSHGRRKVDYEESVSNNRSYQEEFNVNLYFFC